MIGALQSFLLLMAGYAFIFSGIAFSNKQFLPSMLDTVYDHTNFFTRVIVFTLFFALPANFLTAKAFQLSSSSVAGPMLIGTVLVVSIVNAMMLDKVQLTLPIVGAASVALFFCCMTAWLLEAQRIAG